MLLAGVERVQKLLQRLISVAFNLEKGKFNNLLQFHRCGELRFMSKVGQKTFFRGLACTKRVFLARCFHFANENYFVTTYTQDVHLLGLRAF